MTETDELTAARLTIANAEAALADAGVTGHGTLAEGVRILAALEQAAARGHVEVAAAMRAANPASGDEKLRRLRDQWRTELNESRASSVSNPRDSWGSGFGHGWRARATSCLNDVGLLLAESPAAAPERAEASGDSIVDYVIARLRGVGEPGLNITTADLASLREAIIEVAKRVEERR